MKKNSKLKRSGVAFQREDMVDVDPKQLKGVMEIQESEKNGKVLQIGQVCTFIFNFSALVFLQIDEPLLAIAEMECTEFLNKPLAFFFSSVAIREHLEPVQRLMRKSMTVLKENPVPYSVANMEYNIQLSRNRTKRILFQYTLFPGVSPNKGQLAYGKLVDISHFTNDGPPRLRIFQDNQIIFTTEASKEEMLRSSGIKLNKKDLSVLSLQSKGIRVRDIAQKLAMSELSIYSMVRDMKRKTQMETLPLMQMLRKKGLLD